MANVYSADMRLRVVGPCREWCFAAGGSRTPRSELQYRGDLGEVLLRDRPLYRQTARGGSMSPLEKHADFLLRRADVARARLQRKRRDRSRCFALRGVAAILGDICHDEERTTCVDPTCGL
jgi:hypothetical protein